MSSSARRERLNTSRRGASLPPVMEEGAPYALPLGQRLPPLMAPGATPTARSVSPRVMTYTNREGSASPVGSAMGAGSGQRSPAPRGTITSPWNPSPPPAAFDEASQRGGGGGSRLSRSSSPSPWSVPVLDESLFASPIQIQQRRAAESRAKYTRDNRGARSMSPSGVSSGGGGGGRFSPTPGAGPMMMSSSSSSSDYIPQRSMSPSPSYGRMLATTEESSAMIGLDPPGGRRGPRGAIEDQTEIQGYDPEQVARLTAIDMANQLYPLSPTKKLRVEVVSGSLDGLRPKDVAMAISFAYDHPLRVLNNSKGHETWIFEAGSIDIALSIAEKSREDQPLVKGRAKIKLTPVEEYVPPAGPSLAQRVFASFTRKGDSPSKTTSAPTKTTTAAANASTKVPVDDEQPIIVVSPEEEKKNEDEALAAAADVISSSGGATKKSKPLSTQTQSQTNAVDTSSSSANSSTAAAWTMWSPFKKSASASSLSTSAPAPVAPAIPLLNFGGAAKEGKVEKKGFKRFKEAAKKVIETKRVEIEKAKGIKRGGVFASLVQKAVLDARAKKLAEEAAQREDEKLKTIAVVYPDAADGDETGVLPAGAPSSFSKQKPPSLIRVATAQLLKLGMPTDYHKELDEKPHDDNDPHAIWDWHNVLGTGEDDAIKAKVGIRDDTHIDEINEYASSASVSAITGRAKSRDQFILPVIQRRLAHQEKLLHLGEDDDDKPEDSAFIDVMEELKLHKEKKERGLREMVHSLDERPWDKRKITLLTTATPLSFVGMVLTSLAFFIDVTAYYSPWVEYKTYVRDLQYSTYETTIYRKYMDRNEICLIIDPPGGRSAQSPPPFEGCTPYPLAEHWQRSLDTAMKFAVGMSFFAIVWAFLAQRHIRWWIAEFTSPWAKVPLIVGGITGNCGDEPSGTRRLSTRDCGYICNPFLSAVLCFLSSLVLLTVFGIFFNATTGTYDMSYRTGAGWLTLVAGGLSFFASAYLVWSQWIVCPVEHVWHCDLHCHWVQTHVDLEERFLQATPHAEPRQGLPHLICVTKRLIIYSFEEVFIPICARIWPIASVAAKKAAILATITPPKEPGPFDKAHQDQGEHPAWLQKYNEKVHEREEKERIKREKERAFFSPFASLRRSFITKPSLVGRGVNAYVDPDKIYHDPEIASKEHRLVVEVLAAKEREAALKWHEIEVRREADRKAHEAYRKTVKVLETLKKESPSESSAFSSSLFSWMSKKNRTPAGAPSAVNETTKINSTGEAKGGIGDVGVRIAPQHVPAPHYTLSGVVGHKRAEKQETKAPFDRSIAASPNTEIVDTFIAEEEARGNKRY